MRIYCSFLLICLTVNSGLIVPSILKTCKEKLKSDCKMSIYIPFHLQSAKSFVILADLSYYFPEFTGSKSQRNAMFRAGRPLEALISHKLQIQQPLILTSVNPKCEHWCSSGVRCSKLKANKITKNKPKSHFKTSIAIERKK